MEKKLRQKNLGKKFVTKKIDKFGEKNLGKKL